MHTVNGVNTTTQLLLLLVYYFHCTVEAAGDVVLHMEDDYCITSYSTKFLSVAKIEEIYTPADDISAIHPLLTEISS
jgi:hypothetical protein